MRTCFLKPLSLALTVGALLALSACGGGGGDGATKNGTVEIGAASLPAGADCGIGAMPQKLLAAINAARAQARSCGAQQYAAAAAIPYWNTALANAAIRHSSDMAGKGFFSHIGSDGSSDSDRIQAAGYGSSGAGEILMRMEGGTPSVDRAMKSWLSSPGHCAVIMDTQATQEIGGACVKSGNTAYMTVEFGD